MAGFPLVETREDDDNIQLCNSKQTTVGTHMQIHAFGFTCAVSDDEGQGQCLLQLLWKFLS
jgi:hypothetical protein